LEIENAVFNIDIGSIVDSNSRDQENQKESDHPS